MTAALRRQNLVRRLHRLGERALAELLDELGRERSIATLIDNKLERYCRLDPRVLQAVGADRMPPPPLHIVARGER